jgi:hypothetical protein
MKNTTIFKVLAFCCFLISANITTKVFSQDTVISLDSLKNLTFGQLDKSRIYGGILINASVLPINIEDYSDGTDYNAWIKIYHKIYLAHLVPPEIPPVEEVFLKAEVQNKNNIVPLGIINFNYSSIRVDAFDKNLLQLVDSTVLYEVNPLSEESPYELKNCMIFAPLSRGIFGSKVTFLLCDEFIFDNTGSKFSEIAVDFDDGNGFIEVKINSPIDITYNSAGTKTLRMNLCTGKSARSLKSTIKIGEELFKSGGGDLGSQRTPDRTQNIQVNYNGTIIRGIWGVYYGCGNNVLDKPVIVIEGFDPLNQNTFNPGWSPFSSEQSRNLYAINDTEQHILDKLRSAGYDIVILDFANNPIDLRANGVLAAELIKTINSQKVGNNELIVMGRSGGGLIARYALAYLEHNNINHQTRLLLTIDAPHQGANIPLGFQHFLDFATSNSVVKGILGVAGLIMKTDLLEATINSVYARQLLYYHYLQTANGRANPSSHRNTFFSHLNSLGGHPKNLMNVAISTGSRNGANQGFGFNDQLLAWNKPNFLPSRCVTMRLSFGVRALPNNTNAHPIFGTVMEVRFPIIPCVFNTNWATIVSIGTRVNNTLPYDNAPGGNAGWHRLDVDPFLSTGLNDIVTYFTGISVERNFTCFVPVISALDLNRNILPTPSGGLFYNVNSGLATNSNIVRVNNLFYNLSPPNVSSFDIIYVAPTNQKHGESHREWQGLFDNAIMPANLYLQNQNVVSNRAYHARNQIMAGNNVTSTFPQGNFTVRVGTNVKMTSGNTITLRQGFKSEPGATFLASIHNEPNCQKSATDTADHPNGSKTNSGNDIFDMIISTENAVTIYSDPANSRIIVSFNRYSDTGITIEIYNDEGEIVLPERGIFRISEIDISSFPAGMYAIKIKANSQIFTQNFVKP